MAELTRKDILQLARLARLELNDDEIEQFRKEISEILGYVERLQSVKVDRQKPTFQVTGLRNVMRADKVIDYGASQADLLKNVPERDGNYIKVKRVLQ